MSNRHREPPSPGQPASNLKQTHPQARGKTKFQQAQNPPGRSACTPRRAHGGSGPSWWRPGPRHAGCPGPIAPGDPTQHGGHKVRPGRPGTPRAPTPTGPGPPATARPPTPPRRKALQSESPGTCRPLKYMPSPTKEELLSTERRLNVASHGGTSTGLGSAAGDVTRLTRRGRTSASLAPSDVNPPHLQRQDLRQCLSPSPHHHLPRQNLRQFRFFWGGCC